MYRTYESPSIITSLSTDMAKAVASALVNSRLDYANSVLYNTSSVDMLKLQRVQKSLVRVVTCTKRVEHIHPVLHQLYTGFRSTTVSTTRLRHWRIKYGHREVQYTYFHQSETICSNQKSTVYGLHRNICSTCVSSERR